MISIITDQSRKKQYESLARHPLQSWLWGEARQKVGNKVLRIGQFNKTKLVKVFQVTLHKIPHTNYRIGYIARSGLPTKELLRFLVNYGKKRKIIFFKFEPYIFQGKNSPPVISCQHWHKSNQAIFPNWTMVIDLRKTEETLFKNLKSKTRYNIRVATKRGVQVNHDNTRHGFNQFQQLYFATCRRQKYFGHNLKYHQTIFHTLKDKIAHILIASYHKKPLASYELFLYKKRLYYPYGGTSLQLRNYMAGNLLMWQAIKFGLYNKAQFFDLWGSLPPTYSSRHPWAGFTRFKEGYGGEFKKLVGSYDLVCLPSLYPIYQMIFYLRKQYLKHFLRPTS